jgi:hypothetical protein
MHFESPDFIAALILMTRPVARLIGDRGPETVGVLTVAFPDGLTGGVVSAAKPSGLDGAAVAPRFRTRGGRSDAISLASAVLRQHAPGVDGPNNRVSF